MSNAKVECPMCGSNQNEKKTGTITYKSPNNGKEVNIKDVVHYHCFDCDDTWQTAEMFKEYQKQATDAEQANQ
jgi:YgiT-type zinc finger domain-containing protein